MSYFIFGGSGFIGTHLIALIDNLYPGTKIYNLDIVENNHEGKSTYINCDVRSEINIDIPVTSEDVIFNFAAVLPTPNTPYGISKLVAEKIHTIWQAKKSNERQLTIVRPGVVFGKGENGNFTRLYWGIRGGKFFYPGRKDTIKACIYVKELVRFMLYRLENHNEGVELYNCTYEPAFTIEQIVETMKKATGLQRTVVEVPGSLLMTVARIVGSLGGKALGICPARVKKLMISTNICGKKLADSGYKFHYTFEEAIKDWYRDNDNKYLR